MYISEEPKDASILMRRAGHIKGISLCLVAILLAASANTAVASEINAESVTTERLGEILSGDEPTNLAELQAMQTHVQKLIEKVLPTVVSIAMRESQGSGVVVTEDGYVLTAGHVIQNPKKRALLRFIEGDPIRAKTLGINNAIDSGLVKIETESEWPYAEMGDSSELAPGQWVLAVGHPGGFQSERGAVVRLGRILSVTSRGVKTDCPLVGGDSGGPLFDMQGRVIGINSRIGDDMNKNIHVPVNTFGNTWDRLVSAERWGNFSDLFRPGWLGLSVDRSSEKATISKVTPEGPADKAGIEVGDVVLEFDGKEVSDFRGLLTLVVQTPANETIVIRVQRGEEELDLVLETAERP